MTSRGLRGLTVLVAGALCAGTLVAQEVGNAFTSAEWGLSFTVEQKWAGVAKPTTQVLRDGLVEYKEKETFSVLTVAAYKSKNHLWPSMEQALSELDSHTLKRWEIRRTDTVVGGLPAMRSEVGYRHKSGVIYYAIMLLVQNGGVQYRFLYTTQEQYSQSAFQEFRKILSTVKITPQTH